MKQKKLITWYYKDCISGIISIGKNYSVFVLDFFSVTEMLQTLFMPWHRDITFHSWRGFQIDKLAQMILNNLIARLVGGIVRICVVIIGLILESSVVVMTGVILFLWITFPFVLISLPIIIIIVPESGYNLLIVEILFFFLIIFSYFQMKKNSLREMSFQELHDTVVMKRVYDRIGVRDEERRPDIFTKQEDFMFFCKKNEITERDFNIILATEIEREDERQNKNKFWTEDYLSKKKPIGRSWRYGYTVHLDEYGQDITEGDYSKYKDQKLIGRENVDQMIQIALARPSENNVVLVGTPGIGKRTVIHDLARKIRTRQFDNTFLRAERVVLFDLGTCISDIINKNGSVEDKLRKIFFEAAFAGNVIIVIENIERFLDPAEDYARYGVSEILSEYLDFPTFRLVSTITQYSYYKLVEQNARLLKASEVIKVLEPTEEDTYKILLNHFFHEEAKKVIFTIHGLKEIIAKADQYHSDTPRPGNAIDYATEIIIFAQKEGIHLITREVVDVFLVAKTGIPQGVIEEKEGEKLLNLEHKLHERIIGQDQAVQAIASSIRKARSGVIDSKKPIGSFLFFGPTGVGKTEMAKALAESYFGNETKMIRLDMSEFQNPQSVEILIGSSLTGEQGRLTTQAKDNPFTVLLIDEIEKAYPKILDLFLQILDEGSITDAFGVKTNFRNMIIIATSNAGAVQLVDLLRTKSQYEDTKKELVNYIIQEGLFRIEFLNRFSNIIFFHPLEPEELIKVTKLLLKNVQKRLKKDKNINIQFDPVIVNYILEKGFDPLFGARSIKHYIEQTVENVIANKILDGSADRGDKIFITEEDMKHV